MSRLTWADPGERFFEIGVDRGVLYVGDDAGVAWNGLISVDESPQGGDADSFYVDGVMYLQVSKPERFEATITAYNRPDEFGPCEGIATGINGMRITQQQRQTFGLSYRSLIGNDADGIDHGYLIHIIYNARVAPSSRNRSTIDDGVNPTPYSWPLFALPEVVDGYARTPHLIIDSRSTPPDLLSDLEDILYGSDAALSSLPTPVEILELGFGIVVTDNGDGTFTVTGPDSLVFLTDTDTFSITSPGAVFIDSDSYTITTV